ncbi:MAG: ubiquinol-cytochrome C chaperone family protein [Geminicoccaceae bacterium]
MNENNHDPAAAIPKSSPWSRFWSQLVSAPAPSVAHQLYSRLVSSARFPVYYRRLGVPDTPEGRFEILALHVGLAVRRLMNLDADGRATGQALFDLMMTDLDSNLRELGVGDLSVGKQMKRLAGQFYARLAVLNEAFDQGRTEGLAPMLEANVFGSAAPAPADLAHFADIVLCLEQALDRQPAADLLDGQITLPDEQALIDLADHGQNRDPGK